MLKMISLSALLMLASSCMYGSDLVYNFTDEEIVFRNVSPRLDQGVVGLQPRQAARVKRYPGSDDSGQWSFYIERNDHKRMNFKQSCSSKSGQTVFIVQENPSASDESGLKLEEMLKEDFDIKYQSFLKELEQEKLAQKKSAIPVADLQGDYVYNATEKGIKFSARKTVYTPLPSGSRASASETVCITLASGDRMSVPRNPKNGNEECWDFGVQSEDREIKKFNESCSSEETVFIVQENHKSGLELKKMSKRDFEKRVRKELSDGIPKFSNDLIREVAKHFFGEKLLEINENQKTEEQDSQSLAQSQVSAGEPEQPTAHVLQPVINNQRPWWKKPYAVYVCAALAVFSSLIAVKKMFDWFYPRARSA